MKQPQIVEGVICTLFFMTDAENRIFSFFSTATLAISCDLAPLFLPPIRSNAWPNHFDVEMALAASRGWKAPGEA
jgi:hypothetical protein